MGITRNLDEIRHDIDGLDQELLVLFEKRMACAREVAMYKKAHNMSIYASDRESALLKNRVQLLQDNSLEEFASVFFQTMMDLSKQEQLNIIEELSAEDDGGVIAKIDEEKSKNVKVAYQGTPGANSEQAAMLYFGEDVPKISFHQFSDVFAAVQNGEVQYGIVPIENSTAGSIYDIYDLLGETGCFIVGEQNLTIEHCLLAKSSTSMESIKKVYSHPQALKQCQAFLKQYDWEEIAYSNTAAAAKYVAENPDDDIAAIASLRTLAHYDLQLLKPDIQNRMDNVTRFVIVAKTPKDFTGQGKITISFKLKHQSGSLYNVLQQFARQNLNLTKIESRTIPSRMFEYCFYMDFEGDISSKGIQSILMDIQPHTLGVHVLGAYYPDNGWRQSR